MDDVYVHDICDFNTVGVHDSPHASCAVFTVDVPRVKPSLSVGAGDTLLRAIVDQLTSPTLIAALRSSLLSQRDTPPTKRYKT